MLVGVNKRESPYHITQSSPNKHTTLGRREDKVRLKAGETIALADTKSRIISFWAINSDGQESPEITLNSNNGTEDTANGSVRMVHGGADADVWNFEATLV